MFWAEASLIHAHLRSKFRKSCGTWHIEILRGSQSAIRHMLDKPVGTAYQMFYLAFLK